MHPEKDEFASTLTSTFDSNKGEVEISKNNPKYIFQKLEPVKKELVFDDRLAIASTNDHINYFGEAFNLTRNGETLSSGCIAFGMERWLSAIVNTFGEDPNSWPSFNISNA